MATDVLVPPLGTTVDTVTLVKWYREEGENVTKDDPLFAIETDKSTLDVEAPASGILRNVSAAEGDTVQVLTPIAVIAAPDEALAQPEAAQPAQPAAAMATAPAKTDEAQPPAPAKPAGQTAGHRKFISPRAKRLADQHNVPAYDLAGTGPEGAIIERDVRQYLERARPQPEIVPEAPRPAKAVEPARSPVAEETPVSSRPASGQFNEEVQAIPLRGVRATIAQRMAESNRETARVTLTRQVDATSLVALRRQLAEDGVQVSYSDLLLYILGRVLREYPQMNASLDEKTIHVWQRVHVGLAVDTDRGLIVPVIRDVDSKPLIKLAQETQTVIQRAQEGKSLPDELSGGTFTLTNLGMYGIDAFTPIINLPEGGVLGVGRIVRQPAAVGERIEVRQMMWLSLSFDHRLMDGAPAARFLQRVVQLVEHPHLLLTY